MVKKRIAFGPFLVFCVCLAYACSDDVEPAFDFGGGKEGESMTLFLGAEAEASVSFSLHSTMAWRATVDADWLKVFPEEGEGGNGMLTVTAVHPNDTGSPREASVTLTSGALSQSIPVAQNEYIYWEQRQCKVPSVGGELALPFRSTVAAEQLALGGGVARWVRSWQIARSGGDTCILSLSLLPNTGEEVRFDTVRFLKKLAEGKAGELAMLALEQPVRQVGTSRNYSRNGKVRLLQEHGKGRGIPVVLIGDGFIDVEIENGYYDAVMERAATNLFTEEPVRSLRDYFDIYAVTAVSLNNSFGDGCSTALGCHLAGGGTTGITGNYSSVYRYVQAVDGVDVEEVLAVVVLNTPAYAGTTWSYWYSDVRPRRFSIAYCPVIDDMESELFRRVLVHEAVGHGLGKLDDEYAYEDSGNMPAGEIATTRRQQQNFGWWMNVDFTDDPQAVLWSDFLYDPRYDGQGLGVFEGACTYQGGAYRSTEESMMNGNVMGFNAPSRWAIYRMVMERGEGRTPYLDEFIAFDQQTYEPSPQTKAAVASPPFARPRVEQLR